MPNTEGPSRRRHESDERFVEAVFEMRIRFGPHHFGGMEPGATAREACYASLRDGDHWCWEMVTEAGNRLTFVDAWFEGERPEHDARDALMALQPAAPRQRGRAGPSISEQYDDYGRVLDA